MRLSPRLLLALVAASPLGACVSQDDARVQQLLNQRGFGTPFVGDANEQYYLGIGDRIIITDPGHPEISNTFQVRPDGVIHVPLLDLDVYVAGLTLPDVGQLLTRRFREFISTAQVEVMLAGSASKFFYVHGEVVAGGRVPFTGGHSLFDIVFQARPTLLANDDAVRLIRADPVYPLVMKFDYDDMAEGGFSRENVVIRENDIIYVPPNLLGRVAILLETLLAPLNRVLFSVLSFNQLIFVAETFSDSDSFYRYGRGTSRRRYGGFGFGGFYGDEVATSLAGATAPDVAGGGSAEDQVPSTER